MPLQASVMPAAKGAAPPAPPVLETRFGSVTLDERRLIRFPQGLPGFPRATRFQLEPVPGLGEAFQRLQSVEDADLSFVVAHLPAQADLIARAELERVARELGLAAADLAVLLIVALVPGPSGVELFANLRAPLLIDTHRRVGIQQVLAAPGYSLRHPLGVLERPARAAKAAG